MKQGGRRGRRKRKGEAEEKMKKSERKRRRRRRNDEGKGRRKGMKQGREGSWPGRRALEGEGEGEGTWLLGAKIGVQNGFGEEKSVTRLE